MLTQYQKDCLSVQFITHSNDKYNYVESAKLALEGKCRWIQLRMKNIPIDEVKKTALIIKQLCKQYQAIFIIDDYVELCAEIQADGVHLGQEDMPIDLARKYLGNNYIIGGTCNTYADIEKAKINGADYVGLGPFRYTTTKRKLSPILGIDGYYDIVKIIKINHLNIPVIAIGGIQSEDIDALLDIGIQGIAVSSVVLDNQNPSQKMSEILLKFSKK